MIPSPSSDGKTRSTRQPGYLLQTPDTFVRTPMPEVSGGVVIVHASPALGSQFTWLTAELEPGGSFRSSQHSRFFYVLEGEGVLRGPTDENEMVPGSFAYAPPGGIRRLIAGRALRCAVVVKRYESLPGSGRPVSFVGHQSTLVAQPLGESHNIEVRSMMPPSFAYDFAVNTMTYAGGAALPQVEIHYMEHGLLMLSGSGTYRLGNDLHQVGPGDFIWMQAYCPQWFQADGSGPAKYLIYKNFNRMPEL